MKKTILLALGVSSMLLATEPSYYVNMNYAVLTNSDNGTVSEFKPTGFKWTLGSVLSEYKGVALALEASAMLGVNSDTKATVNSKFSGSFTNADTSLDKLYNVNLKVIVPVVNNLNTNVYLGASRARLLSTATGFTSTNDWDSSFTYGAGLSYDIFSDISLNVDYMKYFKNFDAIEFGVGFKF